MTGWDKVAYELELTTMLFEKVIAHFRNCEEHFNQMIEIAEQIGKSR